MGAMADVADSSVRGSDAYERLEYRLDFAMGVLHGIMYQLVGVVFIWAVLTRFPSLGGWHTFET